MRCFTAILEPGAVAISEDENAERRKRGITAKEKMKKRRRSNPESILFHRDSAEETQKGGRKKGDRRCGAGGGGQDLKEGRRGWGKKISSKLAAKLPQNASRQKTVSEAETDAS